MSTGRDWLNSAISLHYLPAIERAKNTPKGRAAVTALFEDMRSAWTERGMAEVRQQKSLLSAVRKAIKEQFGEEHWSLDIINFSKDEWVEANQASQTNLVTRNETLKFLDDPERITAIAVRLLDHSPEWAEIVAGLSLLTGRRVAELLSTAQFEKKSQWSVLFSGAVKRGDEAVTFEIPTLTTADRVIHALAKVRRELPDAVGMSLREVNIKYEAAVVRACDKHFAEVIPLREGKDSLYTHINRAVYATIAVFWFCPPSVQEVEFKAQIQGHFQILDAPDEPTKRSLLSSRHYSDYEISDQAIAQQGGKRKGIKLGYGGIVPIEVFYKAWKADGESLPLVPLRRELSSLRIYKDSLERWNSLINDIAPMGTTQQQKMEALLEWIEQQRKQQNMPVAVTPSPVAESQQGLPSVDAAVVQPEPLQQPQPITLPPDCLSNPAMLQSFIEAIVQQQLQQLPLAPSQTPGAIALNQMTADAIDHPNHALSVVGKTVAHPKVYPAEAEAKVDRAINAIMLHNDASHRRHDEKWEITIRSLKALGCSQAVAYRVFEARKEDIHAHHAKHQILSGHNARHRGKATITQVIHT